MTPRVAILLTNDDVSPFSRRFPNDGDKVASRLKLIRPTWDYRVWAVKDNEFPLLENADAFVITGSPRSVHDAYPWIDRLAGLILDLHRMKKPLAGLCFGHQMIARALGGEVIPSASGWRFGAIETDMLTTRPWMNPPNPVLRLFASHSEQVSQLPAGATLLGTALNCSNASYSLGSHILTTQYHPEFGQDFMKALALEYRGEVPDDVLNQGIEELDSPTDGPLFFEWIAKFIELALADRERRVQTAGES